MGGSCSNSYAWRWPQSLHSGGGGGEAGWMVRGNSYKTTQWPSNLEDTGRSANHHPPHALLSPPSPPPPPHFGALLGAGPFPFSCWPTLLWQVVEWEGPRGMSGADLVQADTFSTRPVSTQHVQNTKHSSFTYDMASKKDKWRQSVYKLLAKCRRRRVRFTCKRKTKGD